MNKKIFRLAILLIAGATLLFLGKATVTISTAATVPEARNLVALVGAGEKTTDVNAFFPANLRIRVSDTVTWKQNGDEIHTVTFVNAVKPDPADALPLGGPNDLMPSLMIPVTGGSPGALMINPAAAFPTRKPGAPVETHTGTGYYSSGIMSKEPSAPGAPPNDTFQLTFTKPGVYKYFCEVHPDSMKGTIEVVDSAETNVPSQADIDAQAKAEMDPLLGFVAAAKIAGQQARIESGPNNTNFVYVRAGNVEPTTADARAQVLAFLPDSVSIKAGDTVIWSSTFFHNIVFSPEATPAEFILLQPQSQGPPRLLLNSDYIVPAKPSATFDSSKLFNSGILTPGGPFGTTWALTFDKPGTYKYFCAVHPDEMQGTIIVQAR